MGKPNTKKSQVMTQTILKTSAITLAAAFVVFSYGLFIFGLVFPNTMADLSDRLGAHNAAGMYYERIYNNNKTPENLYIVLDRYIMAENHSKVIIYGDKLFELPKSDYTALIAKVNKTGRETANNKIEFVNWANEDSRIKSAYTVALLKKGKDAEALEKLQQWLFAEPDLEQPNHAYFAFVAAGKGDGLAKQYFMDYVVRFDGALKTFDEGNSFEFKNFTGEIIFAVDFLHWAHAYLGNTEQAMQYGELYNDL